MRLLVIVVTFLFVSAHLAKAETFPVINNQTVLKECGDCHMAYPPQTLTKAVWQKMLGDLSNHFGEDASLDATVAKDILTYYELNASDVSDTRAAMKWTADTPFTRITEGPRFEDKHGSCAAEVWTNPKIKSKANCVACHKTMQTDGSTDADLSFMPKDLQAGCYEFGAVGVFINGLFN